MNDRTHAAYLADLDYFQTQLEQTGDANLYYPIASISLRLGNHDSVISAAQEGLKSTPFYWQLQVLLAEAYIHVGRKEEAKEILYEAIVSDEDNYKALKLLGMICRSEDDRAGTLKYLRTAYLYAPEDSEIYGWLEEIGGLPISGVSDQVVNDEDEFGDFDSDITFSFDVDKTLAEANDAMEDVLAEITGKPIDKKDKKDDNVSDDEPDTADNAAAEAEVDLLAGNEISDDDILSALGGSGSMGAAMALSDTLEATQPLPDELAATADTDSQAVTNDETATDEGDSPLSSDMLDAADIPLPGFDTAVDSVDAPNETENALETDNSDNIAALSDNVDSIPANVDDMPAEDSELDPFMAAAQDLAAELLAEKEDPELPEDIITDLNELDSDPVEDVSGLPELPAVDELADSSDIDEKALQAALDSFNQLPEEDIVEKPEDDDRLAPIIPKNLVDEVFQESGLDPMNPYGDDEPIDSMMSDSTAKEAVDIADNDAPDENITPIEPIDTMELSISEAATPMEAITAPLDPTANLAAIMELGEMDLDSGISELGMAMDAEEERNLDDKVVSQLNSTLSQLRSEIDNAFGDIPADLPEEVVDIDQELAELVDAGAVGAGIEEIPDMKPLSGSLDDEIAQLWGEDEPVDPEVAKLWAEALEEERTDANDDKDD